jgi:GNAT superfamily N-acetyltransferase
VIQYSFAPLDDDNAAEAHDFEKAVTGTNRGSLENLHAFLNDSGLGALCHASYGGYSKCKKVVGVVLFEGDKSAQVLHVRDILVDPSFRRAKIASNFLHRVSYMARQAGWSCSADVNEENLPAQLLFKACGWSCVVIRPDFFPSGSASYNFVFPPASAPGVRLHSPEPEHATPTPA